ncbi:MAG: formylglycine-generating enzyme family protein, partial [Candidatus Marinimicrobia bacterium]|nr:formylglycine-generating enzyme family protein [Candidatus Neomarinimicrobiota bacterium]
MKSFFSLKCVFLILALFVFSALIANEPDTTPDHSEKQTVVQIGPLEIDAVLVTGGTFEMGDNFDVGDSDEKPVHEVKLSDFYISITEVTVAQYKTFCRKTNRAMPLQESYSKDDYPIVFVTWFEAQEFCEWVGGCLPTEAQWEYAATSGGLTLKYPIGNDINKNGANYSGTGKKDRWKKLSPVAKFPHNILGIYDMAGNVYEWCYDYYKSSYYNMPGYQDPRGPATSMFKVLRGGSWYHDEEEMRCSNRFRYMPVARVSFVGFRVAWNPKTAAVKQRTTNSN